MDKRRNGGMVGMVYSITLQSVKKRSTGFDRCEMIIVSSEVLWENKFDYVSSLLLSSSFLNWIFFRRLRITVALLERFMIFSYLLRPVGGI